MGLKNAFKCHMKVNHIEKKQNRGALAYHTSFNPTFSYKHKGAINPLHFKQKVNQQKTLYDEVKCSQNVSPVPSLLRPVSYCAVNDALGAELVVA